MHTWIYFPYLVSMSILRHLVRLPIERPSNSVGYRAALVSYTSTDRGDCVSDSRGGDFYAVNVACLDDVTAEELANTLMSYEDGKSNQWQTAPAVTAYL